MRISRALKRTSDYSSNVTAAHGLQNVFIRCVPQPRSSIKSAAEGTKILAVKDNICTLDTESNLSTTCGSKLLEPYKSPIEATVVRRLKNNGWATIDGKTNLDEFGMGSHSIFSGYGPVTKPDERSVGGSSGGSAVAVAAGLCDGALGTDTGGSVRLPAAFNGIFGFKPSYGRISRWGVVAYANSLDTVGLLGRSVIQVKDLYQRAAGHDPLDPTSLLSSTCARIEEAIANRNRREGFPRKGLVIGVPIEYNVDNICSTVRKAWQTTLETLQHHGCTIKPVSLPMTSSALSAYYILAPAEASSNLAKYDGVRFGQSTEVEPAPGSPIYAKTRFDKLGDEVRRRILLGAFSLSAEAIDNYFLQAQRIRRLVKQDFDSVFSLPNALTDRPGVGEASRQTTSSKGGVDAIIVPTATTLPPKLNEINHQDSPLESYSVDAMTVPASLAGLPAINVPISIWSEESTKQSTKVGMQVVTQFGDDDLAISIAEILESSLLTP